MQVFVLSCCYSNVFCGAYFMQNGIKPKIKTNVICIIMCIKIEVYVCAAVRAMLVISSDCLDPSSELRHTCWLIYKTSI